MDEKDIPPFEALAALTLKHEAQMKAAHKTIVELMMVVTKKPFDYCEDAFLNLERKEHQKLLESLESHSPALAALLDKRGEEHLPES